MTSGVLVARHVMEGGATQVEVTEQEKEPFAQSPSWAPPVQARVSSLSLPGPRQLTRLLDAPPCSRGIPEQAAGITWGWCWLWAGFSPDLGSGLRLSGVWTDLVAGQKPHPALCQALESHPPTLPSFPASFSLHRDTGWVPWPARGCPVQPGQLCCPHSLQGLVGWRRAE